MLCVPLCCVVARCLVGFAFRWCTVLQVVDSFALRWTPLVLFRHSCSWLQELVRKRLCQNVLNTISILLEAAVLMDVPLSESSSACAKAINAVRGRCSCA